MIEFLSPWFLALGLLGIPVVLAFLSRQKIRERTVPSLVLLRQLQAEEITRRRMAVPNHWLALLLMLLALLALVFAGANPVRPQDRPRSVYLVLDLSTSMNAELEGSAQTRHERGLERVEREVLGKLDGQDRVGLVVASAQREVVLEPTRDRARLREALASTRASGLTRSLDGALQLAGAMCAASERGEIVVVSDLAAGLTKDASVSCPVRLVRVGEDAANLAMVELAVREADTLGLLEVYVEVLNTGAAPQQVSVDIELGGQLAEVLPLDVPAHGQVGRLLNFEATEGEVVTARLRAQEGNALADDDVAYAARQRAPRVRALLVAKEPGSFMGVALTLHQGVDLSLHDPSEPAPAGVWDVVLFEDVPSPALLASLPTGAKLLSLGIDPGVFGVRWGPPMERPGVSWWDFEAPLFQFVDLDAVEVLTARALTPDKTSKVLMRAGANQALMMQTVWQQRELIIMGFSPAQSDLVLRVAFANIVANIIAWASPVARMAAPLKLSVGDVIPGIKEGMGVVALHQPMGGELNPRAPLSQPGVYELTQAGARARLVAVNLLSAQEATLAPAAPPEGVLIMAKEPLELTSQHAEWWWRVPLLLAVACVFMETFLPLWRRRQRGRALRRSP